MKLNEGEVVDAIFDGYTGRGRFYVMHEALSTCRVAARTPEAAIVAAAKHFGRRWQDYSFYAYCVVTPDAAKQKK